MFWVLYMGNMKKSQHGLLDLAWIVFSHANTVVTVDVFLFILFICLHKWTENTLSSSFFKHFEKTDPLDCEI